VEISSLGAEIQSVLGRDGTEYIWQGDGRYWKDRAINLFPYIGRLPADGYQTGGARYRIDIHGFLKDSEMEVIAGGGSDNGVGKAAAVSFRLDDSEATRGMYPFPFSLRVGYTLRENTLMIDYEIINTGKETMYFGIGGHPGFGLPLEPGLAFEDYYLEFEEGREPRRCETTDALLMSGNEPAFPLEGGKTLRLEHSLFDEDAIILRDMGQSVALRSRKGERGVSLRFPHMRYLGLWHTPRTKAPFLCVEPWTSLPALDGAPEVLEDKPDLIKLPPGERYLNKWEITFF